MVDWPCVSNGERRDATHTLLLLGHQKAGESRGGGGGTERDIKVHVGKRITGVGIKRQLAEASTVA